MAALVAAVWLLPYRPDCDSLARRADPAIARVDAECIHLSDYTERLRIIEAATEYAEGQFLSNAPELEYLRQWYDRLSFYGPENIALADAIKDAALYQRAVADGHAPSGEAVSAARDEDRIRSESSYDYVQLVKLAHKQDDAGFVKLLHETRHPDLVRIREDSDPAQMMASLTEIDWRAMEQSLKEGEEYLESIGRERYWQEVAPAKLRRGMAVDNLENAILEASADGPYANVPRLAWLAYQQQVLEEVSIELTLAAPSQLLVPGALAYLADFLMAERNALELEYRRFLERREQRQRLSPTPPPRRNTP